jgi:hypothetical protein
MSTPPNDRAAKRAEARRRQRMAARGELPEDELEATEAPTAQPRGGFLSRLFPPAPPLPNRPSPMAGFDEAGPLRPIRVRAFLLRRNPLAWLGTGLVSAIGFFAPTLFGPEDPLTLLGTFVLFGAFIAAGWIGWQRPALYGTAAAIVGYLVFVALLLVSSQTAEAFAETGAATRFAFEVIYYTALGFLGGWYGGYLRRRQTQLSGERERTSRRR